jgi:hypothetical protein
MFSSVVSLSISPGTVSSYDLGLIGSLQQFYMLFYIKRIKMVYPIRKNRKHISVVLFLVSNYYFYYFCKIKICAGLYMKNYLKFINKI